MSSRCQIRWIEEWENGEKNIIQIYRHSDGYPAGVIADLKEFIEWYESKPIPRHGDVFYASADFIYFMKKRSEEYSIKGWEKLGYGVENPADGIHGDEVYLYIITYKHKQRKWYIKVSKHCGFPSYDTKNAFEKAEWEFEGTLNEAYRKYVKEVKAEMI